MTTVPFTCGSGQGAVIFSTHQAGLYREGDSSRPALYVTVTEAEVKGPNIERAIGRATCSPRDQYCAETGRVLALKRAMMNGDDPMARPVYPRLLRTRIWMAYWAAYPKGKRARRRRKANGAQ